MEIAWQQMAKAIDSYHFVATFKIVMHRKAPFFGKQFLRVLRLPQTELECGPMPNAMVALPNIRGALCSTPQSLADAHY